MSTYHNTHAGCHLDKHMTSTKSTLGLSGTVKTSAILTILAELHEYCADSVRNTFGVCSAATCNLFKLLHFRGTDSLIYSCRIACEIT
jgi:hypothetical protein